MAHRISVRTVIVAVLIGAMVGVGGASFATTFWSDWRYTNTAGTDYKMKAGMNDTSDAAYTEHGRRYSGNLPANYMGAAARGYRDSGSMCSASAWVYNNIALHSFQVNTFPRCGNDYYFSQGPTRTYNGVGYVGYSTYQSPVIHIS